MPIDKNTTVKEWNGSFWNPSSSVWCRLQLLPAPPQEPGEQRRRVDYSGGGADVALLTTAPTWDRRNHQIPPQVQPGQVSTRRECGQATRRDGRGGTQALHHTLALEGGDKPADPQGVSSRPPAMSRRRKMYETQGNVTPHGNQSRQSPEKQRKAPPDGSWSHGWKSEPREAAPTAPSPTPHSSGLERQKTQCTHSMAVRQTLRLPRPREVCTQTGSLHRAFRSPSSLVTKTVSAEKQRDNQDSAIPPGVIHLNRKSELGR